MPVEKGPDKKRSGSPARGTTTPFRIRVPDLAPARTFADQAPVRPATAAAPRPAGTSVVNDDPVARARAKLNERKLTERQQDVPTMIAGMRNRRRKVLDRIWIGSIVLTALSVVALGVELLHELPVGTPGGETATVEVDQPESAEIARGRNTRISRPVSRVAARAWSNELPAESAVKSASYATEENGRPTGATLSGTITDSDSDDQQSGVTHGAPQSRTP